LGAYYISRGHAEHAFAPLRSRTHTTHCWHPPAVFFFLEDKQRLSAAAALRPWEWAWAEVGNRVWGGGGGCVCVCVCVCAHRTRAAAAIRSTCDLGASPAPGLRGLLGGRLEAERQLAWEALTAPTQARPRTSGSARDVPRMRKYRRAARLGYSGAQWSPGVRQQQPRALLEDTGLQAPVTTNNRRVHRYTQR
jgi:hypothetical protein